MPVSFTSSPATLYYKEEKIKSVVFLLLKLGVEVPLSLSRIKPYPQEALPSYFSFFTF